MERKGKMEIITESDAFTSYDLNINENFSLLQTTVVPTP